MQTDMHQRDARYAPNGRAYQLKALRARHHEIIRLHILGYKNVDIARVLGVTPVSVSNALNSHEGQAVARLLCAARDGEAVDLSARFAEVAPKAFEFLEDTLDNENAPIHLRSKIATELLGLAGHVKPQRLQVSGAIAHITPADLEEIKRRAVQAAAECGLLSDPNVLEAEFNEVESSAVGSQTSTQGRSGEPADGEAQKEAFNSFGGDSGIGQ